MAQVAAERDHRPLAADPHGAVAHGRIGSVRAGMVDLTEMHGGGVACAVEQILHLGAAFDRHHLAEFLADPILEAFAAQIVGGERDVPDRAVIVQHQCDIGGGRDEASGNIRRQPRKPGSLTLETERWSLGRKDVHDNEGPLSV